MFFVGFFIFVREEGGSFYGVLFFCLGASFLVLVGGAAVGTLPLLFRFPHLALMGILTPVWVVVLWTIADRTHDIRLRFVFDSFAI